jgi:hypothetical protein
MLVGSAAVFAQSPSASPPAEPAASPSGFPSVVSEELNIALSNGNTVTWRLETGSVTAASATSITISLSNGQTSTITLDDTTSIVKLPDLSSLTRGNLNATAADITVGGDVVVTSNSESDGSFVAGSVWILPSSGAAPSMGASPAASMAPSPAAS